MTEALDTPHRRIDASSFSTATVYSSRLLLADVMEFSSLNQHVDLEPRSFYFDAPLYPTDAPLSPPLFFPDDAQHELDPFCFDDQRHSSSPDLLTPSSHTDSNESVDLLSAYSNDEQSATFSTLPPTVAHPQPTISLFAAPHPASRGLIPPSSSSSASSPPLTSDTSLSVLSSLAPAASRPPVQVELVFPLPAVAKPRRHRTNLSHLSNNERLQHKRARHRQIDATRREREKTAIRRLRLLVEEMTGGGEKGTAEEQKERETEREKREREEDGDGGLGNKTDILESGITLIEQLRDLCSTMQSDGRPTGTKFTRFPRNATFNTPANCPSIIHLLPPPTSHLIAHLDRSQTLRSGGSVTSPICSMMILFPGAVIMDVSRSFLEFSGYTDEQLIHSRMNPWYLPPTSEHHTICPLLVDGKDERTGKVTKLVGQYGASKSDMGELIKGERGRLDLDWRYRLRNGQLMETKTTGWMEDKDAEEEVSIEFTSDTGHTHTWKSHRTLIRMVFARQDSVLIDDDQSISVRPPTWETREVRTKGRTQVFVRPLVESDGRKKRALEQE